LVYSINTPAKHCQQIDVKDTCENWLSWIKKYLYALHAIWCHIVTLHHVQFPVVLYLWGNVFIFCTINIALKQGLTFFLPWVVYMCDMVTLGEKSNILEPRNCISISMSSVLHLWPFDPKINSEHLPPMGSLYVWYEDSRW
jgi:hypothetical protein